MSLNINPKKLYLSKVFGNSDLLNIILNFAINKKYKLVDWISEDYIFSKDNHNDDICHNINAVELIAEKMKENYQFNWHFLCKNPNAIELIENEIKSNPSNINWESVFGNPNAIELIENEINTHQHCLNQCWIKYSLFSNPNALHLIEKMIRNNISIPYGALFKNPNAKHLIAEISKKTPEKLSWWILCKNPASISIIEQELKKEPKPQIHLYWDRICKNPNAIHLIEKQLIKNPETINWGCLCKNPNAIHLIEKRLKTHPEDIRIDYLFKNPNAIHLIEDILKSNKKMCHFWSLVKNTNPKTLLIFKDYCQKTGFKLDKSTFDCYRHFKKNPNIFENTRDYYDEIFSIY